MIELYYWTTPNGHKITMFLEEAGLEYHIRPVNIGVGDQFDPEFLAVSPNNRIPAIVDHAPADGGEPAPVFESGAILLYLADKSGRFLPADLRGRNTVLEWLFWQIGGLGPMLGQAHHFIAYAPTPVPYAIDRYVNEASRLYAVLDKRLEGREFLAGEYSIADIASYPWTVSHQRQRQNLDDYPNVRRWCEAIRNRPATLRAYELASTVNPQTGSLSEQEKNILFGQSAAMIKTPVSTR